MEGRTETFLGVFHTFLTHLHRYEHAEYVFLSVSFNILSYQILTELEPTFCPDICGRSVELTPPKRLCLLENSTAGRPSRKSICPCESSGRFALFPPGLCLYHVLLQSSFPLGPHFVHLQSQRGCISTPPRGRGIGGGDLVVCAGRLRTREGLNKSELIHTRSCDDAKTCPLVYKKLNFVRTTRAN